MSKRPHNAIVRREIERILGLRTDNGIRQFLVQWADSPPHAVVWESEHDLVDFQHAITAFYQTQQHLEHQLRVQHRPIVSPVLYHQHVHMSAPSAEPIVMMPETAMPLHMFTSINMIPRPPPPLMAMAAPISIGSIVPPAHTMVCPRPDCGKIFRTQTNLENHIRIHEGLRPFACIEPNCTRAFTQASKLRRHILLSHFGEKRFACPHCSYTAGMRHHLTEHLRTHSGERPFKCSFDGCHYAATQQSALKKHEATHRNERPFTCGTCQRSFAQLQHLKIHCRSKHPETSGPSSQPDVDVRPAQAAVAASQPDTGSDSHVSGPPYVCPVAGCGLSFRLQAFFHAHRAIHNEEMSRVALDALVAIGDQQKSFEPAVGSRYVWQNPQDDLSYNVQVVAVDADRQLAQIRFLPPSHGAQNEICSWSELKALEELPHQ